MVINSRLQEVASTNLRGGQVNQLSKTLTNTKASCTFTEFTPIFEAHQADIDNAAIGKACDNNRLVDGACARVIIAMVTALLKVAGDQPRKAIAVRRTERYFEKCPRDKDLLSTHRPASRRHLLGFYGRAAAGRSCGRAMLADTPQALVLLWLQNLLKEDRVAYVCNDVCQITIPVLKSIGQFT